MTTERRAEEEAPSNEPYRFEPFDDASGYFAVYYRDTDEFVGRVRETGTLCWYYLDCTMVEQGYRGSRAAAAKRLGALFQKTFG